LGAPEVAALSAIKAHWMVHMNTERLTLLEQDPGALVEPSMMKREEEHTVVLSNVWVLAQLLGGLLMLLYADKIGHDSLHHYLAIQSTGPRTFCSKSDHTHPQRSALCKRIQDEHMPALVAQLHKLESLRTCCGAKSFEHEAEVTAGHN